MTRRVGLVVVALSLMASSRAAAQTSFEVTGARALGMGGAFVAVADDGTAVFWNPAGLIKGAPLGLTIGWDRFQFRHPDSPPQDGAGRLSAKSVAFGSWPLGISFLRTESARISSESDHQLLVHALQMSQLGFTVLQSVGDAAVVGGTIKIIRGNASIAAVSANSVRDALDHAFDSPSSSTFTIDFDFGAIVGSDRLRAGVAFKNLHRPAFRTVGGNSILVERRARLGLAAFPVDGLTLAIDVDLDTADPLVGLRRTIALGGETRLGVRLTVRGGLRWQRGATSGLIGAVGGSLRLRPGFWLDGYAARGRSSGDQGFGVALRVGS